MSSEKIIPGMILICLGLLFFFNNRNISKGVFELYRKMYTKENLKVMFRIAGIVLILGGIILIFVK